MKHEQLAPNFYRVTVGNITLWFSYNTCVAFHVEGTRCCVSESQWSPTTAKHLTREFGKIGRTPAAEFNERLDDLLGALAGVNYAPK